MRASARLRFLLLPAVLVACGKPPARQPRPAPAAAPTMAGGRVTTPGGLSFAPSSAWKLRPAAAGNRVAEYSIPRTEGDASDGELVVTYFEGGAGTVDSNVERWCGQVQQPDGVPSKERARVDKREIGGLKVAEVEVSGRFVSKAMFPGQRDYDEPGWMLFAAMVETPKGAYFFKALGPERTIAQARPALVATLDSVRFDG